MTFLRIMVLFIISVFGIPINVNIFVKLKYPIYPFNWHKILCIILFINTHETHIIWFLSKWIITHDRVCIYTFHRQKEAIGITIVFEVFRNDKNISNMKEIHLRLFNIEWHSSSKVIKKLKHDNVIKAFINNYNYPS